MLYALELVHFDKVDSVLPGHSEFKLMKGAPVLASYQESGFIDMFPLHEADLLKKLSGGWSKLLLDPPITEIRQYFGENLALYISFATFYTQFLVPMAF